MFDGQNHLRLDTCALRLKDRDNTSYAAYNLTNLRAMCPDENGGGLSKQHPLSVSLAYRNLWVWDGYGINPQAVNVDTAFKETALTHPRTRMQLPKRVFEAVPDLSHGRLVPDVESRLLSGHDTSAQRDCDRVTEKDYKRFDPGVCTISTVHIIPPWTNGGAPSREIARSDAFLRSIGYVHDGKVWRRPTCAGAAPA